jgi:hypothetical protein
MEVCIEEVDGIISGAIVGPEPFEVGQEELYEGPRQVWLCRLLKPLWQERIRS